MSTHQLTDESQSVIKFSPASQFIIKFENRSNKHVLEAALLTRNSKWRSPPSWIYFRWLFSTYSRLSTVDHNHHTKVCANIHDRIVITFVNSRWRPSTMLDFRKIANWPKYRLRLLIFRHSIKFGAQMLIDAQLMAQKRNLKWRPPPSWIYLWWLFLTYSRRSTDDIKLPPHNILCHYLSRRLTYCNFSFSKFKTAAVSIVLGTIAVNVTWMERGFNACQTHRSIYASIFNRLRAIARYWSEIVTFSYPLHLTPLWECSHWNSGTKFGLEKITRIMDLSDSEDSLTIGWAVSTQYQRVTDGRTDGQTDVQPISITRTVWLTHVKIQKCYISHLHRSPQWTDLH